MVTKAEFILIDDDPVNNMLSEIIIEEVFPDAKVTAFTDPKAGLVHVLTNCNHQVEGKFILFLDLNMPKMTGWEFMSQFEKSDAVVKERLLIYILSSSVNPVDLEKAKVNPYIIDFVEKPLTEEVLILLSSL